MQKRTTNQPRPHRPDGRPDRAIAAALSARAALQRAGV
ncbi:hypothetical protein ACVW2K_000723 [Nocardioides sp. HB32]